MAKLPKQWWDIVLDGSPYKLVVHETPYLNLTALRSAVYREAEMRLTNVVTHKQDPTMLMVQAWGTGGRAQYAPTFDINTVQAAPTLDPGLPRTKTYVCDCEQGPSTHPLYCSIWGPPKVAPKTGSQDPWGQFAPQDQPSTPTSEPLEADDEALLGPCTCGQSPQCLPDCARVTGLVA